MRAHKDVDDCVILIQEDATGAIIGVQRIDLAPGSTKPYPTPLAMTEAIRLA